MIKVLTIAQVLKKAGKPAVLAALTNETAFTLLLRAQHQIITAAFERHPDLDDCIEVQTTDLMQAAIDLRAKHKIEDTPVVPGAEFWARSTTGGWVKVIVERYEIQSERVTVRSTIHENNIVRLTPIDLYTKVPR
jgi:hypothetical protein